MPAPSPSPALIKAAAQISRDTGCTVEIDKLSGNVRISPPTPAVAKVPPRGLKEWT